MNYPQITQITQIRSLNRPTLIRFTGCSILYHSGWCQLSLTCLLFNLC